ncbi:Aste57867_7711 [Aphanomyces stellatus]|uniref:Aste57867_7711 protein n=1 Tax=Aphanomyces stellatus TaxID=120398 RepID=A0A485KIQ6_9STRA|nr:hypothetical protein As57867_007682 [Aphanomyces stellatus]VFT84614.1 Aste57867_7711 [Aphanomyces stellatus]
MHPSGDYNPPDSMGLDAAEIMVPSQADSQADIPPHMGIIYSASSPTDSTASISLDLDLLESSSRSRDARDDDTSPTHGVPTRNEQRMTYEVCLEKGMYGLGIYFADDGSAAIVDQHVPFYKLPSGHAAPGEASGVIKPGDILTHINDECVAHYKFEDLVEALRTLPSGRVKLTFCSPLFHSLVDVKASHEENLEKRIEALHEELEREKKCRQIAEKRMQLYREEVLRLGELNIGLRCQIKKVEADLQASQKFMRQTHVAL